MRLVLPHRTHPHPVSCTPVSRLDIPPCTSVGGLVNSSKKQRNNPRKKKYVTPFLSQKCSSPPQTVRQRRLTSRLPTPHFFSQEFPTLAAAISHQSTKQRTTGGGDRSRQTLTHKMPSNKLPPSPFHHTSKLYPLLQSQNNTDTQPGNCGCVKKGDGGCGGGEARHSLSLYPGPAVPSPASAVRIDRCPPPLRKQRT